MPLYRGMKLSPEESHIPQLIAHLNTITQEQSYRTQIEACWDITDGSAGLRGRLIKTDDLAEIKLFAATFLSGAAGALTANQQTLLGTQVLPTTQNAALEGAQSVLGTYAKQILDSIERDGFYVRVPAGKQFYLYVTQTIDRTDAAVGESRSQPNEINNPPPQAPSRRETLPIVPMQP